MRALLALLLVVALVPLSAADHTPACAAVTAFPGPAWAYPEGFGARVWLDSNGASGIQRQACTTDGGVHTSADFSHYQNINCPISPNLCII